MGVEININDRLSDLPDEIIIKILGILNTREAVRTSVLSKQWRYYWTHVQSLNFRSLKSGIQRPNFEKFVTDVLQRRQHSNLSKLSIYSNSQLPEHRDQKLMSVVFDYAASHQIEELETDMPSFFPRFEFRSLKILRLTGGYSSDLHGFTSLTVLLLDRTKFPVQCSTDGMFSYCLNLEKLILINCFGPRICCISNQRLILLRIKDGGEITSFVIKAPQLKFCELEVDKPAKLRIDNCPALDNVNIHVSIFTSYMKRSTEASFDCRRTGFVKQCCDVRIFYYKRVTGSRLVEYCKEMAHARLLAIWLTSKDESSLIYKHDASEAEASPVMSVQSFKKTLTLAAPHVRRRWGNGVFLC